MNGCLVIAVLLFLSVSGCGGGGGQSSTANLECQQWEIYHEDLGAWEIVAICGDPIEGGEIR